ncbi:Pirin [Marinomonas aquimarina]|uniref:Pirin n=1 Tax=Marinomonas aquimarina TaxID=295068 RepID=A0A1A8T7A6_9GAMM|nr:pirin family protein [Marinomonas aquimarina]SBS27262.1 Pirin [Marinomonas aquimarina]
MNTPMTATQSTEYTPAEQLVVSPVVDGNLFEIGRGFSALSFRESAFAEAMDPLVMVDHYKMTAATFGPHPHAGLSAVSVLFEDTQGRFRNRDTLGNDFDLLPGDLYWLKAGSGIIHDESPRPGSSIHGLQVFVNLPLSSKTSAPESLHVTAQSVPVYEGQGSRVRILLGSSQGLTGQSSPALPMTILDGKLALDGQFSHLLKAGENAWVYAVAGDLQLSISEQTITLHKGQSIAMSALGNGQVQALQIVNSGGEQAHFALFSAQPVAEAFVQKGPFVMASEAEIERIEAEYAAGKLGHLNTLDE